MRGRTLPSATRFDYAQLDLDLADEARACAARIHALGVEAIVAIGRELLQIKGKLGHGKFGPWLATEFDMAQATAERYMAVAKWLGDKICTMQNLSPETLYMLSRSAPAALRNEIIARLGNGEQLSETEIQRQIAEARASRKRGTDPPKQQPPSEPSAHEPADLLKSIKQEWRKLPIQQQREFLDWARTTLEDEPRKESQPQSRLEAHHDVTEDEPTKRPEPHSPFDADDDVAEGDTAKQPKPHSPFEAQDDVTEGEPAKQPQPRSPLEAHHDVTVPIRTPVECKSRKGVCGYSLCAEVGRCLDV